jgi:hypothetical protein
MAHFFLLWSARPVYLILRGWWIKVIKTLNRFFFMAGEQASNCSVPALKRPLPEYL